MTTARRPFHIEFLLAVVTLGFYMPFWLWRRNADLRAAMPTERLPENAWALAGGLVLSFYAAIILGFYNPLVATALMYAGIGVFCYGAFLLAQNAMEVADRLDVEWTFPPWLFGVGLALAFMAVQYGQNQPTWLVRGPALALMFATPFYFYRVHEGLEDIRAALAARRTAAAPSETPQAP